MKYVLDATKRSGAWPYIIGQMIINLLVIWADTLILKWISDMLNNPSTKTLLLIISAGLVTAILEGIEMLTKMSRHNIFRTMAEDLSNKVLDADVEMFNIFSPGTLQHNEGKLWSLSMGLVTVLACVKYSLEIVINLVAIGVLAGSIVLAVAALVGLTLYIMHLGDKSWRKLDEAVDVAKRDRDAEIDEIINGYMEVRSFSGRIEAHRKSIHDRNVNINRLLKTRNTNAMSIGLSYRLIDMAAAIILVLYVCYGDGMSLGATMGITLVMYAWRLLGPSSELMFTVSGLSELRAALPELEKIMAYENKIVDGQYDLDRFYDSIKIDRVSFGYDSTSTVLDDSNMVIHKGQHIGICGESGSGKTSLMKLIPRFYDVNSGMICVDDVNIRDIKIDSLRRHIGIVHQSAYIFDGTIRDNIAYPITNREVLESEIIEAAKKARLYDFITSLPDGFDTKVGPRGYKLSGGQKQRISLARLFLNDPDIVILDEATSALDNETERFIQEAIDALKEKTIITVAHRLSTIKNSDRIYVFQNHKIVEAGTDQELMDLGGVYAKMRNA